MLSTLQLVPNPRPASGFQVKALRPTPTPQSATLSLTQCFLGEAMTMLLREGGRVNSELQAGLAPKSPYKMRGEGGRAERQF